MFSTACDCALITSTVSTWRPFSFYLQLHKQKKEWGVVTLFLVAVMQQPVLYRQSLG
jgi:hypothetical protein